MSNKLKVLRKRKGLTQAEMAEKLGYKSVSGYGQVELGKRRLDLNRAKRIAEILEVDVKELFFDQDLHGLGSSPFIA